MTWEYMFTKNILIHEPLHVVLMYILMKNLIGFTCVIWFMYCSWFVFLFFNSKVISLGGHGCKHVGLIVSREMENGALSEELRTKISLEEESAIALQQKQQKLKVEFFIIIKKDCYELYIFFIKKTHIIIKVMNVTCRRWNMQTKHKWI